MERHYAVWATFLTMNVGLVALFYLSGLFLRYIERTRNENPAKANLVQLLACLFGICGLMAIKIFVPSDNMYGDVLSEVSTAGIVGLSFFGFIFGALFVARKIFAKKNPTIY